VYPRKLPTCFNAQAGRCGPQAVVAPFRLPIAFDGGQAGEPRAQRNKATIVLTLSEMHLLIAAVLLICTFVCACPVHVEAFQCPGVTWRSFERTDGDADPETRRRDAEVRAALANLERTPIVFRGRFAWARDLSKRRKNGDPTFLVVFKDVKVLRGEMPWSVYDRKAFVLYSTLCDDRCGPERWPPGRVTVGADHSFGGPVKDTNADGTISKKVVYRGRVDAVTGGCIPVSLTPLEEKLLKAPADEIARLKREYPFHAIRKDPPPGPE
jgi:hypothetical protein